MTHVQVHDSLRAELFGWPKDQLLAVAIGEHIAALAGTHLDPNVVQAFLPMRSSARADRERYGCGERRARPERAGYGRWSGGGDHTLERRGLRQIQ
jgi:hypothetical protein